MPHLPDLERDSRTISLTVTGYRGIDLLRDGARAVGAGGLDENVERQSTKHGNWINARMPREPLVLNGKKQVN